MEHQISIQDLLCGRTFQEPSAATEEQTSKPYCKPSVMSVKKDSFLFLNLKADGGNLLGASWEMVSALPGVSMTLNFGEYPSEERESILLQILEENAPVESYLSRKACAGLKRRSKRRKKTLPNMLQEALTEVIGSDG